MLRETFISTLILLLLFFKSDKIINNVVINFFCLITGTQRISIKNEKDVSSFSSLAWWGSLWTDSINFPIVYLVIQKTRFHWCKMKMVFFKTCFLRTCGRINSSLNVVLLTLFLLMVPLILASPISSAPTMLLSNIDGKFEEAEPSSHALLNYGNILRDISLPRRLEIPQNPHEFLRNWFFMMPAVDGHSFERIPSRQSSRLF